ncbi:segregation and condensation protein A [Pontibacter akesuensis]|uniref:Segregation and condensation protein A n=1 Tax=Pontibacter akesuensis TaxID=388950 RepID=A0A1I7JLD3_9BACT|nr:segregation/condensation protein A [Pontibacter akesuensis]GHA69122.1 segregation and condensation protein A [Pontibacter akesuensis]SFU86005.1 condensin subunit ScpA [Pontibacter akesuensis]
MSFEIRLPLFEGPFDLLLFFIERDELEIHDIPIFQITNEFMGYLKELEQLNIEVASDFILTAATLMRIKAKMLLPRAEKDEEGNEIDPREELVQHLLEYKKYKSATPDLSEMEDARLAQENRGNIHQELQQIANANHFEYELQDLSLYKIMRVFEKVMTRYEEEQNRPKHTVIQFPYTVEEQRDIILKMVQERNHLSFVKLVEEYPDKIGMIFNFLAILDMLQLNLISIEVGEGFNDFVIMEAQGQATQVMQLLAE